MSNFDKQYLAKYDDFRFIDDVYTPGFEIKSSNEILGNSSVKKFYGDRLLQEFQINDDFQIDSIGYVDKLVPHSFLDMMFLSTDEFTKSSMFSLSKNTGSVLLKSIYNFLEFISDKNNISDFNLNNGFAHFCYNYDPDTNDRESGMFENRFHLHMNYWSGDDVTLDSSKKFSSIESLSYKRRLIDPGTYLGERIVYQKAAGKVYDFKLLEPNIDRDIAEGLPPGIKIKFYNWQLLKSESFRDLLRELHQLFNSAYIELTDIFLEEKNKYNTEPWKRRKLREKKVIIEGLMNLAWADEHLKQDLINFASSLKDIDDSLMDFLQKRKGFRVRHLSLAGLNYSMGIFSQHMNTLQSPLITSNSFYVVAQTKLFADVGGAGIPYMNKIPLVKLNRNHGVFNEIDIGRRKQFHSDFINFNNKRISQYKGVILTNPVV